jgi:hypothetical protein
MKFLAGSVLISLMMKTGIHTSQEQLFLTQAVTLLVSASYFPKLRMYATTSWIC